MDWCPQHMLSSVLYWVQSLACMYVIQAVKGDVVSLGQALSRLTQRVEAHDQQGLDRSQAVADMSQKQWMECRYGCVLGTGLYN